MADTHTLRGAVIVKYGEFNSAKNLMIMYLHIYYILSLQITNYTYLMMIYDNPNFIK